jgi:UDP:flavonoid glycosyltransferase YjiC (YdhE family)
VHCGAGVRLDQSATPAEIAAAIRDVLADDSYRGAAERIARVIEDETATDLAVAEIEAVVAAEGSRAEVTA